MDCVVEAFREFLPLGASVYPVIEDRLCVAAGRLPSSGPPAGAQLRSPPPHFAPASPPRPLPRAPACPAAWTFS